MADTAELLNPFEVAAATDLLNEEQTGRLLKATDHTDGKEYLARVSAWLIAELGRDRITQAAGSVVGALFVEADRLVAADFDSSCTTCLGDRELCTVCESPASLCSCKDRRQNLARCGRCQGTGEE